MGMPVFFRAGICAQKKKKIVLGSEQEYRHLVSVKVHRLCSPADEPYESFPRSQRHQTEISL
jgi:hypothetical protein